MEGACPDQQKIQRETLECTVIKRDDEPFPSKAAVTVEMKGFPPYSTMLGRIPFLVKASPSITQCVTKTLSQCCLLQYVHRGTPKPAQRLPWALLNST